MIVPQASRIDQIEPPATRGGVDPDHDRVQDFSRQPAELIHLSRVEFAQLCRARYRDLRPQGKDQQGAGLSSEPNRPRPDQGDTGDW